VRRTLWIVIIGVLVGALGGAAAGWLTAPRYRPTVDCGEQRLRERAAEFYRAAHLMDYRTMVRSYTPAWQQADADNLRKLADDRARMYSTFKDETRTDMQRGADSIAPADIEVEREGDWAVTRGEAVIYEGDLEIPFPLEDLVWLRTGGDWWVYQRKNPELRAYGNPPDFARELLIHRSESGLETGVMQMPREDAESGGEAEESTTAEEPSESGAEPTPDAPAEAEGE